MRKRSLATRGARFAALALATATLAALLVSACGDDDGDGDNAEDNAEMGTLTLRATDYAFEVDGELRPGVTRVVMSNEGEYDHYALIFKVEGDHTVDEVIEALGAAFPEEGADPDAAQETEWPEWATWKGGPAILSPGETAELMVDFEPGRYVVICPIGEDEPGGVPHFAKGMTAEFTLRGDAYAAALPAADIAITGDDDGTGQAYGFGGTPAEVEAGERLIEFTNAGSELHEFLLFRLPDGATLEDALEDEEGALELVGLGGPAPIPPGDRQQLRLDFEPGRYALVCFLPNPEGVPHVALGMAAEIEVH